MRFTGLALVWLAVGWGCGPAKTAGPAPDASAGHDAAADTGDARQSDDVGPLDAAGDVVVDLRVPDDSPSDTTDSSTPDDAPADLPRDVRDAASDEPRDAVAVDKPSDATDASPPVGGCPGVFCEDFETGRIDPAIWNIQVNGGQPMPAVVSQTGMVAHGRYAARFHVNPNVVSYGFIITKNPPADLRGHHFGRAYFMVTPMPPTNHTEYLFAGTTGFPEYRYLEVASAAPLAWQLTYVDLMPPTTGEDYHSGGTVPTGRWFCLEWEFDDAPDRAAVYVDGALAFSQSKFTFGGASTGLIGGFAAFGFGFYAWHPATYAFDVLYDDIVLDTKRVGCL